MRKLATIRVIQSIEPIAGKDHVELAHVDGWTCMISKADNFKAGDKCVFCEPDSIFPVEERWSFLNKYHYRIKVQKFKDGNKNTIFSQGLVLPLNVLNKKSLNVGDDVTKDLNITQWEDTMDIEKVTNIVSKKYPKWLMRWSWFRKLVTKKKTLKGFPSFISKTDEERVQNCYLLSQSESMWVATEKVDGQSGTFLIIKNKSLFGSKYEYHVYSRNYENNDPNSSYNIVFNKYNLKSVLAELIERFNCDWIAIQGECIGPNIQKNKYKVKEYDLFAFNLITPYGRLSTDHMQKTLAPFGVQSVPIIGNMRLIGKTCDEILDIATDKSALNPDSLREGIVFRSLDGKKSFKAVSPTFLEKYDC